MSDRPSLQETYAPKGMCFGCGPANAQGLRIRSIATADDAAECHWTPAPHHQAFEGMLNGGICGALLDCHSNWTAAWHLMRTRGLDAPPCTVTAEFAVKLKRPTPMDGGVTLHAKVVGVDGDKVTVDAELTAGGKVTATCHGIFVAVKEGHPAFHRW
ncbi:MAG TPA: PaaI family thioesterase [Polyangiaceae bacterium]|jgi:acyl-coenzyme A thioesterase PaaI-like protein